MVAPADECGAAPYDCAVSLVQRQEFKAAIVLLEKLVSQSPQNLRALNLFGIALTEAGLLSTRREGYYVLYRLERDRLAELGGDLLRYVD